MATRDAYRFINDLDASTVEGLIIFFAGFAEVYAPLIQHAGLLTARQVEDWLVEQRRAVEQHTFFAACNFYAYMSRRPTAP